MNNTAFMVIADRAMNTPEFKKAIADIIDRLVSLQLTVSKLRAVGGWTKVIHHAMDAVIAETPSLQRSIGSALVPTTIADVLRTHLPIQDIRIAVQKRINRAE